MSSQLMLVAFLASTTALRGVGHRMRDDTKGCEKTFHTFSERLKICNAENRGVRSQANADIEKLKARIEYNDCRIKELKKEWAEVSDEFRTGNRYLRSSLLAHPSNASVPSANQGGVPSAPMQQNLPPHESPVDEYYYSDRSPAKDPGCACVLDDQCECVAHCRNMVQSCMARFQSMNNKLYERWKSAKRRIRYQEGRTFASGENIRRTRAADPEKDTDGKIEHKYRVSRCGGKPHLPDSNAGKLDYVACREPHGAPCQIPGSKLGTLESQGLDG